MDDNHAFCRCPFIDVILALSRSDIVFSRRFEGIALVISANNVPNYFVVLK